MDKKVLVLDLDGTLTNSEKKITPETKKALMEMQEQGHTVVLASGRPTAGIEPLAEELNLKENGGYILSFNGGKITDCSTGDLSEDTSAGACAGSVPACKKAGYRTSFL